MATHADALTAEQTERQTWFGHPRGLTVLVALKVWELFSFQGMRAFLIFYLISAFALAEGRASVLFGSYAALVLATSVLGGLAADRWLGPRLLLIGGALLIMSGHACLALQHAISGLGLLPQAWAFQSFCLGLALISVGTGLLKPNVLTLIGALYRGEDPRRENGFYAYYLGVNVGSFLAPLVCGYLADAFGWGWGFGAAGLGMAAGLGVLFAGRRHLPTPRVAPASRRPPLPGMAAVLAACVVLAAWLIQNGVATAVMLVCGFGLGGWRLIAVATRDPTGAGWRSIVRLFALLLIPFSFVVLFEQFGLSVNLFVDRLVDTRIGPWRVAAPQLLALNGLFVLLMLPLSSGFWNWLRTRGREPSMAGKFAIGFALVAAGFMVLAAASHAAQAAPEAIGMVWVVLAYLLITLGEVMISPLAYAAVGRIVSPQVEGVSLGLLMLAFAAGNLGAGYFAAFGTPTVGAEDAAAAFARFFLLAGCLGLGAAGLSLALRRSLAQAREPLEAAP